MVCRTLSVQEGAQGGSQRSSAWECTPGGLLSAFGSGRHPRWSVEHFQFRKAPKVAYRVLWVRECTLGGLWSAFGSGWHLGWSVEHFQFRKAPKVVPKGLLLGNAPRVVY